MVPSSWNMSVSMISIPSPALIRHDPASETGCSANAGKTQETMISNTTRRRENIFFINILTNASDTLYVS